MLNILGELSRDAEIADLNFVNEIDIILLIDLITTAL